MASAKPDKTHKIAVRASSVVSGITSRRPARPLKPHTEQPKKPALRKLATSGKPSSTLKLPDSVSSPQDLGALILEIKAYARWAEHAGVKLHLHQKVTTQPPALTPAASELLHLHSWANQQPLNAASCDKLIRDLEHIKSQAPVVTITLAAPATKTIRTSLVSWYRQNVDPSILVNFQFNGTLLGGMTVRFGSHIYDWSFRRRILDNRSKFAEILRKS